MAERLEQYLRTITSFSGADVVVTFHDKVIGEVQQLTWNISREKAPIYVLGHADPVSFSRGKRGIAGSLVLAQLNRDALIEELTKLDTWQQIAPPAMWKAKGEIVGSRRDEGADFAKLFSLTEFGEPVSETPPYPGSNPLYNITAAPAHFERLRPDTVLYADQLPPFDITVTYANELGQTAFMKIFYVDVLSDSGGVSIDSMVMERPLTWIARRMSPIIEGVYSGGGIKGITNYYEPAQRGGIQA